MVRFPSAVVLLASATTNVFAAPHPDMAAIEAAAPKPYKGNTTIGYFVGASGDCSTNVGNQSLAQNVCKTYTTSSVSIDHVPGYDCKLTLFTGDANCGGTNNQQVIALAKGNGTTCVGTGVLDGGKYYHGSGIWSCP